MTACGGMQVRSCRVCGCTDADCSRCIERTGAPCTWAGDDVCSACTHPVQRGPAIPAAAGGWCPPDSNYFVNLEDLLIHAPRTERQG